MVRRRTSAIVGFTLLAQVAAAGILLSATSAGVWLLGIPLDGGCAFRRLTGLPCPTCGMTRSIVLALHGQIAEALRVNFAGPVWILAVIGIGAALVWLGWRAREASRQVTRLALAHGAAFALCLVVHWIYSISRHV